MLNKNIKHYDRIADQYGTFVFFCVIRPDYNSMTTFRIKYCKINDW